MTEGILRGISDSKVRTKVRALLRQGWTIKLTGGNHLKVTHPNGRSVVTGLTSSDRRAWRYFERNVRAVEEGRPTS